MIHGFYLFLQGTFHAIHKKGGGPRTSDTWGPFEFLTCILVSYMLVALVFDLPPVPRRRKIRMLGLAVFAALLTWFLLFLFYQLSSGSSLVGDFGGICWFLLAISFVGLLTISFWLLFYQSRKAGDAAE